jgi:hypothetical protein
VRRIFDPKKDKYAAGRRQFYSGELHDLYPSPDIMVIIKEDEIDGACSMHWEVRNGYKILVISVNETDRRRCM